jgi:hypothetical protein
MDLRETPEGSFRRHPWELARYRFFSEMLYETPEVRGARSILDVGSGDAFFAHQFVRGLDPQARITCWDIAYRDKRTLSRTLIGTNGQVSACAERPTGRFDVLMLLDVLEHVEDDESFLRTLVRENCATNAGVLVSVPAWQFLSTTHDVSLGHHRRYRPREFFSVLDRAGLRCSSRGGLFHSLLVPRALVAMLERVQRARGEQAATGQDNLMWNHGGVFTKLVESALRIDTHFSRAAAQRGLQIPGLSVWAMCRT